MVPLVKKQNVVPRATLLAQLDLDNARYAGVSVGFPFKPTLGPPVERLE